MQKKLILTPYSLVIDKTLTAHDIQLFLFILSLTKDNILVFRPPSLAKRFHATEQEVMDTIKLFVDKNYFILQNIEEDKFQITIIPDSITSNSPDKIQPNKTICSSCPSNSVREIIKNNFYTYILLRSSSNTNLLNYQSSNSSTTTISFHEKKDLEKQKPIKRAIREKTNIVEEKTEIIPKVNNLRNKKIFRVETVIPLPTPTKDENEIINKWNEYGFKMFFIRNTKVCKNTLISIKKLKNGTLFISDKKLEAYCRIFSTEEILSTLDNLGNAFQSPENYNLHASDIQRLRRTTLGEFLYNPYSPYKSEFTSFLDDTLLDNHKDITKVLKRFYISKVLGGIKPKKDFSFYENGKFIEAGKLIYEFYNTNKRRMRLTLTGHDSPRSFATLVCEAIESDIGDVTKISPGYFSSELTFNRRIPAYLNSQGVLMKEVVEIKQRFHI